MKKTAFLFGLLFTLTLAFGQSSGDLVQFSGLVVSPDSLRALPLVSIKVKNTDKGTFTDQAGFFSFVVRKGDTVVFSFIGAKTAERVIPSNLKSYRYSIIQPLADDTLYLPETVIRGWPTIEEFNYYFVKARIPDQGYEAARYNTRRVNPGSLPGTVSADAAGKYYLQQQSRYYYSNGQLPPQRLFDVFAWNEFYKSWQRGDYKKK